MNEIYVCNDHVDIGIEKILDVNKVPILETSNKEKCDLCKKVSAYVVKQGEDFED